MALFLPAILQGIKNMDTIKFSKNVNDGQAKKVKLEDAIKLLDAVMIHDFEVKQTANESWKFHGTRKHDLTVAIDNMDIEDLKKLAREKLIINLQSQFRDLMMATLGLGTEGAGAKKLRESKERLKTQLENTGLDISEIDSIVEKTFQ